MSDAAAIEARLQRARDASQRLRDAIAAVVIGQDDVVEQVTWALFAGGHALLEGAPGLGKTLLVRTLASSLALTFSRVQFTPDLMPSDVTGTNVLVSDAAAGGHRFALHRGPIFGHVVLADEINRATPKTQSALLEAMAEHAVTIAGTRHALEEPFCVLATENPIEMEGTYPLPEAQLDRFLLKILVPSPSEDDLVRVLGRTTGREADAPAPVLARDEVLELRALCREVLVAEPVLRYAARLVGATDPASARSPKIVRRALRYGAGVRGAQSLVLAAKAAALLKGRPHVSLADIRRVAKPALRHRLLRSFEGEADGVSTDALVDAVLASVPERPDSIAAAVATGAPRDSA